LSDTAASGTELTRPDPRVCQQERTLHGILLAGAWLLAALLALSPLYGDPRRAAVTYGPGVVLHVAHLLWLRGGNRRTVAISHCLSYFVWITAIFVFQFGGLRAPAALVYPPLVLMAGLVWSGQAALVMALLSCGAGAALVWLEARGWLERTDFAISQVQLLLVMAACLWITAVMLRYALIEIQRATAEALESEKRHAEQRQQLERELREAQRIEALGRLAGGVAHDFNNLLTIIISYAGLLQRTSNVEHEAIDAIELAAQRARTLTRQLLAFGRRQILRPEVLDLSEALRELLPLIVRLLTEDLQLDLALAGEPCFARVDKAQLSQVVINLVANAKDSMPSGGTVTLATGQGLPEGWSGDTELPERNVWLSVSDTGAGMSPMVRSRIFEPFFTTKSPHNGTGLGLATVQGIVAQSGGVVGVESAPGRGTRFVVSLPLAVPEAPAAKASRTPKAPSGAGLHILVVDDDAALLRVMQKILEAAGYKISVANSIGHALEQIAGPESVSLMVSDVVMPGMSGPELARRARQVLPSLRVLFVSGHARDLVDQQGGFDPNTEFLAKPFGANELVDKVKKALDGNQAPARASAAG
jgi:signal transduction histidine kinase/ActR/RegA family two-component response regulator